jgi:hypothetical protein
MDEIQRICKFFDKEFVRDGSSKNRTGWGYKLTFYDGENIAEEIIVQSENRIDYDGYFWKIEHGSIPINVFDDLLGEILNTNEQPFLSFTTDEIRSVGVSLSPPGVA